MTKKLLLVAVAALTPGSSFAQTPYVTVQYSEPIAPLNGGNLILGPGSFGDEARLIPIGFTFRYFDIDYTHVNVGENGALYFAQPCPCASFTESCNLVSNVCEAFSMQAEFGGMPNAAQPNAIVAPFWDDLYIEFAAPSSEVRYDVRGFAPNRELVVEWRNMRHNPQIVFPPDSRMSFQVRLQEGTNTIKFHYGAFNGGQSNVEWSGVIGIEDQTGTNAVFHLACGMNNTCSWIDLNSLNNMVIEIAVPNAPELTGSVGAPRGGAPGTQARFPVTVRNIGLQPTNSGYSAQVYLSSDPVIVPASDTLLGTLNFSALASGETDTATLTVNIPSIPQGFYTVGAVIDSSNQIMEPVETNNTVVGDRLFLVGRDVTAAFDNHPGLTPGQNNDIFFDLINESSAQPNVLWRIYLSANTIRDANDTLLASGTTSLPASSTTPITDNVPVPAVAPGAYRLIAHIDPNNTIAEVDEFDNEIVSAPVLLGPELSISDIGAPTMSGAGATLPLTISLVNAGAAVDSARFEVFISTDTSLNVAQDQMVYTGTAAVGFGTTAVERSGLVPTSLMTGDYYLIARIDPANAVTEIDENNNITVNFNTIRLNGPDLAAIRVDVPDTAFRGQPYRLRGTIENQGGSPLSAFYAAFYLSENELITISDPQLIEVGPIALEPDATVQIDEVITFPATVNPGEYFIGFVADSREIVVEEREINNIRRTTNTITVRDVAPDFLSSEIIAPSSAGSGESFYVQRVLENVGNDTGTSEYIIFLVIEGTNVREAVIGRASISLDAGGYDEGADLVTVPADVQPGDYRVEYVMDSEELVDELDEENNSTMSVGRVTLEPAQLAIVSGDPTLAVIGVDYQFDMVARGGTGPLSWSLTQGALPDGLMLDPNTGRISGQATTEGVSTFGVRVSDGSLFHERAFGIRVISPTTELRIVTRAIPPAFVGSPYDFPLVAIGGVEPYIWGVEPSLPEGLALTGDGRITGTTSTVAAAITYTFVVSDATGAKDDTLIAFRVLARDRSVRFDQAALPDGIVGEQYDAQLVAVGGVQPYTFGHASGDLPPGLSIANGRIAGVPSMAGTFIFELTVTDDAKDSDRNLYVVTIDSEDQVRFVTRSLPTGKVSSPYLEGDGGTVRVRAIAPATDASQITYDLFSGTLPDGLMLASDGSISGTPTKEGIFAFTLAAHDPIGETDFRAFGLVIEEADAVMPPPDDGCGCTAAEERSSLDLLWLLVLLPLAFRRKALFAMLFALVPLTAQAQFDGGVPDTGPGGGPGGGGASTPYFLSEYTEAYTQRSGGTVIQPFNPDEDQVNVQLPFSFRFFDQFYTSMDVATNGLVNFDGSFTNLANQALPDPFAPNGLIALYWDDLVSPSMTMHVEGNQPNRILIIQYTNSYHWPGVGETMNMQLWLYEGLAGLFEIHYGPMTNVNLTFFDATVGFENFTGTEAYNFRSCSPACSSTDLTNLEGVVLRAIQDAGEDVFATDIVPVIQNDPIRVYQGVPFDVESQVTSYHADPLGPFQYAIHLVDPTSGMVMQPAVLTSADVTLGAYENLIVTDSITLPLTTAPGRYQLALVVDSGNAIAEPSEMNNTVISRLEILVGERLPDFTVASVTPVQTSANPGGTLDVDLELSNSGNLDGATSWRVVLSGNRAPSIDDVVGASSAIDESLAVGQTTLLSATLDVPADLTPGQYWVGVVADPDNAVSELLEVNNVLASAARVQIGQGSLDIDTASLPVAYLGLEYRATLRASGGDGSYLWAVEAGALPTGIALDPATGNLTGIPDTAGEYSVTFRVESGSLMQQATLDVIVAALDGPLTIVTRRLLPGIVGLAYPPATEEEQRIVAIGGAGPAMFTATSSLPPGLTLDSDGFLHGAPTAPGDFYITVEASDGTNTATREIPMTIAEPGRLTLIGERLPNATYGEAYGHQLSVTGDNPLDPPVYMLVAGMLPTGLNLSGQGEITGAATQAGDFIFNVEVREIASGAKDTATFYLTVTTDEGLNINPGSLPPATLGQMYDVILVAEGGMAPIRWIVDYADDLPRGIMEERVEMDGTTKLRFFGTPEEVPEGGAVGILVKAEDAAGRTRRIAYALAVMEAEAPPPPPEEGCGCTATEERGGASSAWLFGILVLGLLLRMSRRIRALFPILLAAACDCDGGGSLTELQPKLVVSETLDFGDVGLGIEVERVLVLKNDGEGTLKISDRSLQAELEDFRVISVIPDQILAKQEHEVRIAFTPILLGASSGTLTLSTDDQKKTHTVALTGRGVVPGITVEFNAQLCDGAEGSLSFGRVPPGSVASIPLTLRASGSQAVLVMASRIAENATAEFTVEAVPENTSINPGEMLELTATYQPGDTGPDTAAIIIETDAPGSRTVRIPLCGEGAAPVLCAETLDLGRVAVGSLESGTMVVTNCSSDPVEVTSLSMSTNPASDPGYSIGTLSRTLPTTLAPNEAIDVEVRLDAQLLGTKEGWVHAVASSAETPNVFFRVTAEVADTCGLDIVPTRLIFPDVLVGSSERRNVLLANAGTDPCAITRVEITSGGSVFTLRDPFSVPRSMDPGFSDVLQVRYQPTLPGATDNGVLEVQAGPRVHRVDLVGNPPLQPGCQLDVTPDYINFGTVPGGDSVIRQVKVRNIGLNDCDIDSAEFSAETSGAFTNIATQIGPLPTGAETTMIVTFRAPPTGNASGVARVTTNDVDSPVFEVGLFGAAAAPSICVTPRDVDFGMTMNGIETFRVWACGAEPVTITDLTWSRPDDEFFFDNPPALPAILQPLEERIITVHYVSADDEGDSGVITVGSNDPVDPLIKVNVVAGPVIVPPSAGRYLYYWQIDSFGPDESNIARMPLQGAPIREDFWGPRNGKPCTGCHGVSLDGKYVSVIEATSFSMQIIDTDTNLTVALPFQAPSAAYVSFRPDPNSSPPYQFLYDDGDRIHVGSVNDGYIGELPGANDPNYGSKMASWGSNGLVAFARGNLGGGWGFWGPSDIMIIDEAGGVPVPLSGASGNGSSNYYPAFHPNGNWIAITESLQAQGTISAPDSRIKLIAADQSGTVLDLPLVNCPVGQCGSSFPTWSIDGEFLSFSSNRVGGVGGWDMYISDIDPVTGDAMPPFNIVDANTPMFEHAARWSE